MSFYCDEDIDPQMHDEVQKFLETVYSKGNIPEYELNATTLQILHQIITSIQKEKEINEAQITYYKKLTESCASERKDLKQRFESMGISVEDFPLECTLAMEGLAKAACALDLKEPSSTNFLLALNEFSRHKCDVSVEEKKWSEKVKRQQEEISELVNFTNRLKKDIETAAEKQKAQSAEADKRKVQTDFISKKIHEYNKKLVTLEDKLKSSGYQSSLSHTEIAKKYEELCRLEKNLEDVKIKLESYHSLPANENLARLKVEEAKQELFKLEQEWQKKIELRSK